MGGSDEGEGKGTKAYGVVAMVDGPGSVSTLMLVDVDVVAGAEDELLEGEDDVLLLLERDELAGLEVDVKEGNDDEGSESDEGVVGGKREDGDDGAAPDVVEGREDGMEGSGEEAAKARPVPRRASRM